MTPTPGCNNETLRRFVRECAFGPSGGRQRARTSHPGPASPATPLTDCVENANVSCAYAIRSLLTSSAWSLLLANVSQARW